MGTRGRFILRYTGAGPPLAAHVTRLRNVPGTKVLDESDRMLLVEGDQEDLEATTRGLDGWVLTPERTMSIPDPRKKIKDEPG
jgi:hypothetical protein